MNVLLASGICNSPAYIFFYFCSMYEVMRDKSMAEEFENLRTFFTLDYHVGSSLDTISKRLVDMKCFILLVQSVRNANCLHSSLFWSIYAENIDLCRLFSLVSKFAKTSNSSCNENIHEVSFDSLVRVFTILALYPSNARTDHKWMDRMIRLLKMIKYWRSKRSRYLRGRFTLEAVRSGEWLCLERTWLDTCH